MITIRIANTTKGRRAAASALEAAQAGARSRTVDMTDNNWRAAMRIARRDGYFAEHGGGVANSFGFGGQSTGLLVVPLTARTYSVSVARGQAPSGPCGNVGPSVRRMLGCPWNQAEGRAKRLLVWAREQLAPQVGHSCTNVPD